MRLLGKRGIVGQRSPTTPRRKSADSSAKSSARRVAGILLFRGPMKASIRLAMSVSLALTALALAGCNDSGVVAAPVATETPVPTATPPNPEAPVAIIDNNSPIYDTLDTAEFDGWLSYDVDGYIANYAWTIGTKPAGSTAAMLPDSIDGSTAQLYIDMPGDYSISL